LLYVQGNGAAVEAGMISINHHGLALPEVSERGLTPIQRIIADTITKHGRSDSDILLAVRIVAALAEAGYSVVESPRLIWMLSSSKAASRDASGRTRTIPGWR
jgi:hypothetical protein